mmetsp:Transcript_83287/g.147154  ORF Transcript_83287/g.147154 Transcript_83287/m.147154 type:complete len:313 (-) Transcript_83287:146-1084(-)|eukprot:CAMPEP_0197660154 /NCGR_PEP_ID=MMETSP1338-20131121/50677_1 /TAXON_ID=43686 ORGANISM="Pelagodinium beii, Strain RCC1491" /NCGR_SAMPLE_ID=MMETSP1338 /ASSEMBLY_ACC=CAM_ASM_000754 /LENGTH=312 /DNA_ID=CAMNT_0043237449 /DNA_START=53 /DNA_END=991 /DNA_ORIENTATION=+
MAEGVQVIDEPPGDKVVSEEEVIEYAEFLGIDPESEPDLLWIAREGVATPCPHPWKACTQNGEDVFYFNFETGESLWDHPCDEKFRTMVEEQRLKSGGGASQKASSRSTEAEPQSSSLEAAARSNDEVASSPDSSGHPMLSRQKEALPGKKLPGLPGMKSPEDLKAKMTQLISAEISADEDSSAAEDDDNDSAGVPKPAEALTSDAQPKKRVVQRPPELSQLDLSGQSLQSSKSAGISQDLGLSLSGLGSSLDLSVTVDGVPEAAEDVGQKVASGMPHEKLAADIQALTRCLTLLQGVRQQQQEYLRLVQIA